VGKHEPRTTGGAHHSSEKTWDLNRVSGRRQTWARPANKIAKRADQQAVLTTVGRGSVPKNQPADAYFYNAKKSQKMGPTDARGKKERTVRGVRRLKGSSKEVSAEGCKRTGRFRARFAGGGGKRQARRRKAKGLEERRSTEKGPRK